VRAIGPGVSKLGQSGNIPAVDSAPRRGFIPPTSQHEAGIRTEPPVSLPSASGATPAASAAALPLLEPPAIRPGRRGLPQSP
jgi:hypothetical protein